MSDLAEHPPAAPPETPAFASPRTAPFLVWPVARREYYFAICTALMPTLIWGAMIFGWRALAGTVALACGAVGVHVLLRRLTTRGKRMLIAHSVGSALIIAALGQPLWPGWLMLLAGMALAAAIFAWGGPGRERIVSATLIAILLMFLSPRLLRHPGPDPTTPLHGDRILARDRMFMGDLRNAAETPQARWERSRDVGGDDALPMYRPSLVAHQLLDALSRAVGEVSVAEAEMTWKERVGRATPAIEDALVHRLPALERVATGSSPGLIGCVSGVAIGMGGLYLAYRNILRPRSSFLFLFAFIIGLVAMALTFDAMGRLGVVGMVRTWQAAPGFLVTLLAYSFFGSDAIFAAVFLLAWPGFEPITPRGRRVFLVVAGLSAAVLHRFAPIPLPAATLTLTVLHPLAGLFDLAFKHYSWMNRR